MCFLDQQPATDVTVHAALAIHRFLPAVNVACYFAVLQEHHVCSHALHLAHPTELYNTRPLGACSVMCGDSLYMYMPPYA